MPCFSDVSKYNISVLCTLGSKIANVATKIMVRCTRSNTRWRNENRLYS
jgi:hypothetical protein